MAIPEDDDSPICEWCNKPVAVFGELCAGCSEAMRTADEGEGQDWDAYWSALEEAAADFVDTGGEG
jgi:hypothetical protein